MLRVSASRTYDDNVSPSPRTASADARSSRVTRKGGKVLVFMAESPMHSNCDALCGIALLLSIVPAIIRDKKPQSIAELSELTGRAQPNLTRTLGKLAAIGFVRLTNIDRRKVPTTTIRSLRIKIDPFSQNDRLELA